MKMFLFLFFSFFFVLDGAYALPSVLSVNGGESLSNGQSITVTGLDFGSKATAAPLLWQDFDDGEAGDSLDSTGFWSISSDNIEGLRPQFDDDASRDGGGLNAFFNYPDSDTYQRDIIFRQGLGIGRGEKVFLSIWIRSSYPGPDQPSSKQWKIMRLSDGPYNSDTYPDFILSWNRNGFFSAYRDGTGNVITPCVSWPNQIDYMSHPTANTWFNFMIQASVASDVQVCDGTAKTWYNGSLEMDASAWTNINDETDLGWDEIWIGEYIQNNTEGYMARFDDVYIDDSWSRIEIGNANTYETCTHREVQIPQTWSDTGITFLANQGSFEKEEAAYLYVVDADGVVNAEGFPVSFASELGTSNPSQTPTTTSSDGCQSTTPVFWSLLVLSLFLRRRIPLK